MNRLNRLLPKASPTARSGASTSVMALTPVPSSGKEVAVASRTTPMNERPNPVLSAMMSADLARKLDARRMNPAAARSCTHSAGIDWAISGNCSSLSELGGHAHAKNDPDSTGPLAFPMDLTVIHSVSDYRLTGLRDRPTCPGSARSSCDSIRRAHLPPIPTRLDAHAALREAPGLQLFYTPAP